MTYPYHMFPSYTPPCHWCNTPAPGHTPTCKYRPVPPPPRVVPCECGSNETNCHSDWCPAWRRDGRA